MRSRRDIKAEKTVSLEEMEDAFISSAKADRAEGLQSPEKLRHKEESSGSPEDLHRYVYRTEWPILPFEEPSLAEGRNDLDKGFLMRLKEDIWLSVERHCKALGVGKSEWVRHAMLKQMAEEQKWFKENK